MKYQAFDIEYYRYLQEKKEFEQMKNWMYKGLKYGYFLFIIVIILSALFRGNLVLAQSSDIDYTFDAGTIYEGTNLSLGTGDNTRNQTEVSEVFNSTWSFTDDSIGSNPSGWTVDETGGTVNVHSTIGNHGNILEFYDNANPDRVYATADFGAQEYGTVEFWVRATDTWKSFSFQMNNNGFSGTNVFKLLFDDDTIQYRGSGWTATGCSITDNTWYHVRTDFELTGGGYMGLPQYRLDIYLDGDQIVSEGLLSNSLGSVNHLQFWSGTTDANYDYYIDALGITNVSSYELGDNLIPYMNLTDITDINAWDFKYNEDGSLIENTGETDIPFWNEPSGTPTTYIGSESDGEGVWLRASSTHFTIDKDFSVSASTEVLEVGFLTEWTANFVNPYTDTHTIDFEVFSYDDTLIVRLRAEGSSDLDLYYYDGASYNEIFTGLDIATTFDFNFSLFIYEDIVKLNSNVVNVSFPKITAGKDGLGEIEIDAYATGSDACTVEIYIGEIWVYADGISESEDYGEYQLSGATFYGSKPAWFYVNSTDAFGIGLSSNIGYSVNLASYRNWTGYERGYDSALGIGTSQYNGSVVISASVRPNITALGIYHLILSDGVSNIFGSFTYGNIDLNESWFYISGTGLYFTMTSNDTELEYMSLEFDVNAVSTVNYSLAYKGSKSATSVKAEMYLNYDDASYNYFSLEPNYKDLMVSLPQKIIDDFTFLISDYDNDANTTITGHFGSFSLVYVPSISTTFVSLTFFDVVPIIVLVVLIPIALYIGFGKRKEMLVPAIIGMSIIGTVITIIPLWLLFVILFGCISYYLINKVKN